MIDFTTGAVWVSFECPGCGQGINIPGETRELHTTDDDKVYHKDCYNDSLLDN